MRLPLTDREIPIVLDDMADPEFGSGAVKITPAHDPNDFEAGKRHNLPSIQVIDENAKMTAAAGRFAGLDRFEARKQVVAELEKLGLLEKIEPYKLSVGKCHRCKTIVEPLVSKQWWMKMKPLAEPAIKAVEDGRITFVPANWSKTYFEWMYNIRDWCISRQLWWGHRIPAWHCGDCKADHRRARDSGAVRALRVGETHAGNRRARYVVQFAACGRFRRWAGRTIRRICARFIRRRCW